jgi:hypothetical protein
MHAAGITHLPRSPEVSLHCGLQQMLRFGSLKVHLMQAIPLSAVEGITVSSLQPADTQYSEINQAGEFDAKLRWTVLEQTLFRFFWGKPGWIAIRFLGLLQQENLAEIRIDRRRIAVRNHPFRLDGFSTEIAGESARLHPAMNAGFFKSFERRRLRRCEPGFDAAFWEDPTTCARLHEQKFDAALADAIANRRDLAAGFG